MYYSYSKIHIPVKGKFRAFNIRDIGLFVQNQTNWEIIVKTDIKNRPYLLIGIGLLLLWEM